MDGAKSTSGPFRVEEVPLNLIEIGPSQSRSRKIEEGVDDLAANIAKVGLLHPVVVFKTDGKYELLAGQRRFLAVTKLGWQKIPAHIMGKPSDDIQAKAISFAESFMRKDLLQQDLIDACVAFYHRYGSMRIVAEELGLPEREVRKYVKIDRLPKELQQMVKEHKVALDVALKAADAATIPGGDTDTPKAMELAKEMARLSGSQRRRLVEEAEEHPLAATDELVENARKPPTIKILKVELNLPKFESLKKFAAENAYSSEEEAAVELIVNGLSSKGY